MTHGRDIMVIGGSAGAHRAVLELVSALPADFAGSLFVVLHAQPAAPPAVISGLGGRLTRSGPLPAHLAVDGETIRPGHLFLAPSGATLLLDRGRVRVQARPSEHLAAPSINALFRTAALAYGPRVVGIILSGLLNDGTAGLWEIKQRGGVAIVQTPLEAAYPAMPRAALRDVAVDYCVPVAQMAPLLATLIRTPLPAERAGPLPAGRVLIVEDEAIVALDLERALAARGYRVCAVVDTGEAALEAVRADLPDVVLMDIRLPGSMDGTQAADAIWQQYGVPVVYVTAHGDAQTLAQVMATAPYGYVLKPYDPAQVHAALQLALDRRARERPPA